MTDTPNDTNRSTSNNALKRSGIIPNDTITETSNNNIKSSSVSMRSSGIIPNDTTKASNDHIKRSPSQEDINVASVSLFRSPLLTLYYFFLVLQENLIYYGRYVLTHPGVMFVLFPLFLTYLLFDNIPGAHEKYVQEFEEIVLFVVWWISLGVLSSIGLGTGMHTGLLFLFPHVMKVCLAATECQSTNFDSRSDMWLRNDPNTFVCYDREITTTLETTTEVAFFEVFKKVFFACFLWGTGTAIGEIPPYAISRAAALAGIANKEFEDIKEAKSKLPFLDAMKLWMIDFLQRHGFIGVIMMSAWPNAAFDLCGICCGHFLMPFWSFFLATFIGKALMKINLQACFFITLFTESYASRLVGWIEHIIPSNIDPCMILKNQECHIMVRDMFHTIRSQFYAQTIDAKSTQATGGSASMGSLIKTGWNVIIFMFIGFFVISCIEQFAKAKAFKMKRDQNKIKVLKKKL
eukprot:TRINITY_DN6467_c0_g1_i1.p1 TRINITY_DN6467_c0_g1~~TRINITY_DN6467_c0_g1_i1.p1  ORF type:complete len:463 (-),score=50.02 TRINITY_DN6467_c0_g1_i1:107-1495(-)